MNHHDIEEGRCREEQPLEHSEFPYAVLRHFSAVYQRMPVRFIEDVIEPLANRKVLLVPIGPFERGRSMDHRRIQLVARLAEISSLSGRRACAVFGPADAVYVEPTGQTRASADIPRGGAGHLTV